MSKYVNEHFEQFRNSTNFYEIIEQWDNTHQMKFNSDHRLKNIFSHNYY